MCQNGSRGFV
uniref:Uncharacterized protein n=1 Tax=Anguilla anguilla TaxID=7936 RepID=A0A0E9SE68_ANGAN